MYPFANLTFDQMVETYLPRAKEIFQTGDLNEWKKERMAVSVKYRSSTICIPFSLQKRNKFACSSLQEQIPLFYMFIRGHYSDIFELNKLFGSRFILGRSRLLIGPLFQPIRSIKT